MINRRSFLIFAPAVAFAGASLLTLSGCLRKFFANTGTEPANSELARIVDEYLNSFPQEKNIRLLCETLSVNPENIAEMSFLRDPTILHQVQQDFAMGRTVAVAGWILSRTEVRVLALRTLLGLRLGA